MIEHCGPKFTRLKRVHTVSLTRIVNNILADHELAQLCNEDSDVVDHSIHVIASYKQLIFLLSI
ncbi:MULTISPECIES: hypothetical protein [unclassified Pseudoalteromonas]|uniref:hypothetical protein n=1 Tax=unclassified Pseudoalteromonas TaxID=194690 RepID=UPI001B3A71B9|nr:MULTISPECIES: hypothetical protein [unclassified Pseudoalteromonas]MBQ4844647.1 hypothetical protein [Pseudoalteromonas sp. MMG005]MBQ4850413.1 hypothetical protein [Pseudoalteromonas sp. MMG012]